MKTSVKLLLAFATAAAAIAPAAAQQVVAWDEAYRQADARIAQLTLDEKISFMRGYSSFFFYGVPEKGMPYIYLSDATQGVHMRDNLSDPTMVRQLERSTAFPCPIALAATFNPSLFGSMPLHWVPVAADVCAIADWIVRILLGLFSVWLYRNTSKKNIDKIYSEYPEGDARTDALLQKGGTSIWAALLYFGIVLLLSSLVINLAGPGFVQYAMAMAGY